MLTLVQKSTKYDRYNKFLLTAIETCKGEHSFISETLVPTSAGECRVFCEDARKLGVPVLHMGDFECNYFASMENLNEYLGKK